MGPVHLILFLLALSVEGILAESPCNKTLSGTGKVNPVESGVTNCTFNFKINISSDTLMLAFSSLQNLGSGDNITVYTDPKENISFTSEDGSVTIVSSNEFTTVTFLRSSQSNSSLELFYQKECKQDIDRDVGYITSPKYLPGPRQIMCTYNVTNQEGLLTLLKFDEFNLNSSFLTVNGKNVTAADNKLPDDMLLHTNTTIVFNIVNTSTVAGFSSFLSSVNRDCSFENFTVGEAFKYNSSVGAVCHVIIDGSSGTSLVATVNSWQVDPADLIQFRDGLSQFDSLLMSGSAIQPNIVLVSSGPKMGVHLEFENTRKQRNVEISFARQVIGGRVNVGGTIEYDNFKSGGKDGVFQCTLDAGKKVSLTGFHMSNNGMVDVYDGNLILGNPLFTIKNTSLNIPVFMKTNQMTVVAKNVSSNYTFNATVGEARAGDQFSQPEPGSYAVTADGPNDTYTYNLIIVPLTEKDYRGTLQLDFKLQCDDKVTIFEGITTVTNQKELAVFKSNTTYSFIPQFIFAAEKGARIVTALSKCETRKAGDVVLTAFYNMKPLDTLCGNRPSSPRGSVVSPYYPLRYPVNLKCQWSFENKTDSFLYISVIKLNISGSSLNLTGNIPDFNFSADQTLGKDLIFSKSKELMLSFSTESTNSSFVIPDEGFVINYAYLDCGGSMKSNFNTSLGGAKKDCRWVVSLPTTASDSASLVIIDVKLRVTGNYVKGSLIVYDGPGMIDSKLVDLTNLTTNKLMTFKSRFDTFIIQYLNSNDTAEKLTLYVDINKYVCKNSCTNGICMHDEWKCNGFNDCGDNSDEVNCTSTQPPPKPAPQPDKGEVPGFWLAIMLILGLIIGILLPFIVPAIYRRMKKRNYNRMTDMDNITADDYTPMD